MNPAGRLGWPSKALTELGLDSSCLGSARRLVETERDLQRRGVERQQQAQVARQAALKALVDDPSGSLDGAAAAYIAEAAWLDVQLISNARRLIAGQVAGVIIGAGPIVWPQLKAKAAEVVAEVAELPPIPEACGACGMRRTSWRSTGSTVRRGER